MAQENNIAIIGTGNIGSSIAQGLVQSSQFSAENITLTRRRVDLLADFKEQGFNITDDNTKAVTESNIIILCVEPHQIDDILQSINPLLETDKHLLISVASGVDIESIKKHVDPRLAVVRAMPNTAIAIRQSMTCLAASAGDEEALAAASQIFETVGETLVIEEEQMTPATALCACGIAFFLRSIRAASQGGIETGIDSKTALKMAAQTAKGAASLLLENKNHPEFEIDKVTTPMGCTIAGLNQMEHQGFSSAMIRGIAMSAEKAKDLH